jgi:predicted SnoaL-like aldol condensation-catalyzing enzyme
MTDTDANKNIVTSFIDRLFTQGNLSAVDDYLSDDFVNHDPPFGATADREGMRSAAANFRAAFPDWRSELHLLVAEGDLVAEVFTARGTHGGR